MNHKNKILGGVLLISGTTIGAAMLALPVSTGLAGLIPSFFSFIFIWLYLTISAFYLLEVNLWMKPNTNLITMSRNTLGTKAQFFTLLFYLYLLYALTCAYLAGSAQIFSELTQAFFGFSFPRIVNMLPLVLFFGYFVYLGTSSVDTINRVLMLGLVLTYILIVGVLFPRIETSNLEHMDFSFLPLTLSVVVTSFGFHVIIPTLSTYMERNVSDLKKSLLIGSFIPLIVYLLWQIVMLGVVPLEGPYSIFSGYTKGDNIVYLASYHIEEKGIGLIALVLALFTIITSFLGVSTSLLDCLSDGFKLQSTEPGREFLWVMTFIPPMVVAEFHPRAFLTALEYAGAFGVVTLLGLLPALMVYRGRYTHNYRGPFRTFGGKPLLFAVIAFSLSLIAIEIFNKSVQAFYN